MVTRSEQDILSTCETLGSSSPDSWCDAWRGASCFQWDVVKQIHRTCIFLRVSVVFTKVAGERVLFF